MYGKKIVGNSIHYITGVSEKYLSENEYENIGKDQYIFETNSLFNKNVDSRIYEINELKQKLNDTDYKAIKYAEGQLSEEEYAPAKVERQEWRDRINELETSLESEGIIDDN